MFEEEKLKLEEQINDKLSRLQEIKQEQKNIEEREELIKEYELAKSSIKFCKKILKIVLPGVIVIFLGMIVGREISFLKSIVLALIASGFCIMAFGGEAIKEAFQAKKVIKENKAQYEEAKTREEKDKELSLTLSNEYAEIEQDMLPLQYRLSRLKKIEALEKLGYQLELMASKLNEQYYCVIDNRNKEAYEQLWEQYLEESKDYSKVHLYNPEMESTQVLVKKL